MILDQKFLLLDPLVRPRPLGLNQAMAIQSILPKNMAMKTRLSLSMESWIKFTRKLERRGPLLSRADALISPADRGL